MALVLNASSREQCVQVHGSWFTFKPKQIKHLDDNKAFFLTSNLAGNGFIGLGEEFEDAEYKASKEGKAKFAEIEAAGIENRVRFLSGLLHNETVSMKKDMAKNNDHTDPRLHMSKQMLAQLEELAEYKQKAVNEKKDMAARVAELEKMIEGS
jgi:hypothetical protein